MRLTGIGIAAALVLAFAAPGVAMAAPKKPAAAAPGTVDAKAREAGMAATPALATSAGLACTVSDARIIGEDKKTGQSYYEIACSPGLGGVLIANKDGSKPQYFTCLETTKPGPDGKPGQLSCILPANTDLLTPLAPFVAKSGTACTVEKARSIGASPSATFIEVACAGSKGFIMQTSAPPDVAKEVKMISCLGFEPGEKLFCELTDKATQLAVVDGLAAASGKNCAVKDKRYVLATVTGSLYYEVSCQDGKGYMLEQKADGSLARAIPCVDANFVGGGCTMTDTAEAKTEQNALYSRLATKAGFPCAVEKYGIMPTQQRAVEVVELKCSDRPDGGVGIFGNTNTVLNCAISEAQGYRCSFSPKTAAFSQVTANLRTLGKTECTVSDTRAMDKRSETLAYIETACSDGLPGWVIGYTIGTNTPKEALSCLQAQGLGGCKLATNKKK